MKKSLMRTMLLSVTCLAVVSCQTPVQPCDVLVKISPKPETNRYLIANDRETAVGVSRHRGRYLGFQCEDKDDSK
jgi:hypothetical protein